jgi:hypothetical protein
MDEDAAKRPEQCIVRSFQSGIGILCSLAAWFGGLSVPRLAVHGAI